MIIKECIDCAIGNKEKVASCPNDDDDLAIDNDDDDCPMRKKLPPSLIARSVTIQLPRCQQDMSGKKARVCSVACSKYTRILSYYILLISEGYKLYTWKLVSNADSNADSIPDTIQIVVFLHNIVCTGYYRGIHN